MAEATLQERIAFGKRLFQQGKARNVGSLQGQVKRRFGKGIPPGNLGEVFGTTAEKRAKRKKKATGARRGRPPGRTTATRAAVSPGRAPSGGFDLDLSSGEDLDRWMHLVTYLNDATGGRPKFAVRLDGVRATLVAD